ncbi:MAG: ribonuclease E/G [Lachnospiraceae bacterium]|nr:ribonuclease E/G [Lachnospiraceae bacterium]
MDLVFSHYGGRVVAAYFDKENNNRLVNIKICGDESGSARVGDIYVGRVKNVVKNIRAAFVEIADGQICFMQFSDETALKNIHNETALVVQVAREAVKTKQAVVTTNINLQGRYLIKTHKKEIAVSSKIKNTARKKELTGWLGEIAPEKECGYIIRTNAVNATRADIEREYQYLENLYLDIMRKADYSLIHSLLYRTSFAEDEIRDCYDERIDRIVTDDSELYEKIGGYIDYACPHLRERLWFYEDGSFPLNAMYGLAAKIDRALAKKVWLDSGAYLVIEPTEACTVIDVNTGKAVKKGKDREKHFFNINCEAADEAMRQISLRNLSGIIIIDFIDMKSDEDNKRLMELLTELASNDSVKTSVVDMTGLGLVELTRKKVHKPLYEMLERV